jgi:hypothetical protein
MQARTGHQRSQALHELQRVHDDMGGAVFVRGVGVVTISWLVAALGFLIGALLVFVALSCDG